MTEILKKETMLQRIIRRRSEIDPVLYEAWLYKKGYKVNPYALLDAQVAASTTLHEEDVE